MSFVYNLYNIDRWWAIAGLKFESYWCREREEYNNTQIKHFDAFNVLIPIFYKAYSEKKKSNKSMIHWQAEEHQSFNFLLFSVWRTKTYSGEYSSFTNCNLQIKQQN